MLIKVYENNLFIMIRKQKKISETKTTEFCQKKWIGI